MHVRPSWRRAQVSVLSALFVCTIAGAAHAQSNVPSPWTVADIGSPAVAGSATYGSSTFTVMASGSDIWGTADHFTFVYQKVSGDVDVVARVDSVADVSNWSKAGVMIRSALTASAAQGFALVSAARGTAFQRRTATGDISTNTAGPLTRPPGWVRLVRSGTTVTAYTSTDGTSWQQIDRDTIALGSTVYVGLAVTSHNDSAVTTAELSHVQVTPLSLPSGMQQADIGSPAVAGAAGYSQGTFSITAQGDDIWGTADQFHYVYQKVSGDLDVVARVASVSAADRWSKAGVMIRESLSAGSRHAFALVSAGRGYAFQRRVDTNGTSESTDGGDGGAPGWVRLVRSGAQLQAFRSADGKNWTSMGTDAISMADTVYVGIAVTSHSDASTRAVVDSYAMTQASTTQNRPPSVTLTSPADGATYAPGASIRIKATASDSDGTIAHVDLYVGSTRIKRDTTLGYSTTWSTSTAGTYQIKAIAFDNDGSTATSTVSVTVGASSNTPTVALTSPANGATYAPGASIPIKATAAETGGSIARVDFYVGSTRIKSDTTVGYSTTWSTSTVGTYQIKAIAYDANGASATATLSVAVKSGLPPPPTAVSFTKSPDDAKLVTSYRLDVFASGADPSTATAVASVSLGKPAADSTGTITVTESSFFSALAPGTYIATVSAVGTGGIGRSAPVSFTR
ncbi:MAG TPA: Ig-like domain-containing protein [Vicinamibacterales bacterium]|nr:Ig-like domain-containing protein [Vicinamibacterales bacterium]